MGTETLKPCPFCGSEDLRLMGLQIVCFRCSLRGPSGMLPHPTPLEECKAEAARLWNALAKKQEECRELAERLALAAVRLSGEENQMRQET